MSAFTRFYYTAGNGDGGDDDDDDDDLTYTRMVKKDETKTADDDGEDSNGPGGRELVTETESEDGDEESRYEYSTEEVSEDEAARLEAKQRGRIVQGEMSKATKAELKRVIAEQREAHREAFKEKMKAFKKYQDASQENSQSGGGDGGGGGGGGKRKALYDARDPRLNADVGGAYENSTYNAMTVDFVTDANGVTRRVAARGVVARRYLNAGDVITKFGGILVRKKPSIHAKWLQLAAGVYLDYSSSDAIWANNERNVGVQLLGAKIQQAVTKGAANAEVRSAYDAEENTWDVFVVAKQAIEEGYPIILDVPEGNVKKM